MNYGKWQLINGTWIRQDVHSSNEPTKRGIIDGYAPAGFVHTALKYEKNRRFDKPSDDEIRRAQNEDNEYTNKAIDITSTVRESKQDLQSGKIKIESNVIDDSNKRIRPFSSVTDDRGVIHIIPQEKVQVQLAQPTNASPLPGEKVVEMKDMIEGAWDKVRTNRSETRRRTF